jgi:low temperature requirement protein LtrA
VSEQAVEHEHRITPLELFFDLVFVFAFTQVTTVFTEDTTWAGVGHGLLILAALWWAWASYAWLTNTVDAGEDGVLAAVLVAMAAMFVAALAVPDAFGHHGVVFGVAFLIVAVMHLALYALSASSERELLGAILRIAPLSLLGASLILAAGFVHGPTKSVIWIAALAVGFLGPLFGGTGGWQLAPAHFVERHGLIVIIAIGESLIAIGLGARSTHLGIGVIGAALLGLVVVTSFWLAYFDFFPMRAQQLLTERHGADRIALARDAYSYLHLPMVAGIVLFAFAMKVTLAHVGHELGTLPAFALCAGSALYLLAFALLRLRVARRLGRGRTIAAVACLAVLPVAREMPALVALTLVAAIWVALHAYELIWWREARADARAQRA